MKITLSFIALFFTTSIIAQNQQEYANFIQTDTAVKWAVIYHSFMDLTPKNENYSIRNFYQKKLNQAGAISYLEDSTAMAATPQLIQEKEFNTAKQPAVFDPLKMNWQFFAEENNDASETIFNSDANSCQTCLLKNRLSFFKVKQLLYYKNHRLQIQNILISPVIYTKQKDERKTEAQYLETSNFAFNDAATHNTTIPPSAIYMGRASNSLTIFPNTDIAGTENKILTLKNWNLSSLLYRDIKANKIKAYDTEKSVLPDNNHILDPKKIEAYKSTPMLVPMYDSLGNEVGVKKMIAEMNYDSLYHFTLIQDLYFDFEKEKLYSKLIALVPRITVVTSSGIYLGLTDYWGVIFPEEKPKIIKKTK